jgi:type IV pilus assembly protein PilB
MALSCLAFISSDLSSATDYVIINDTMQATAQASYNSPVLQVLIDSKALSDDQVNQILLDSMNSTRKIEEIIQEKKWVSEEQLTKARSQANNVPFVKVSEIGISPEALTLLPESVARRYRMFPFSVSKDDNLLSVAMIDPLDLAAIDFAQQTTGYRIQAYYALPSEIERIIAEKYAQSLSNEVTEALQESSDVRDQQKKAEQDLLNLSGQVVRQAPIIKIVETILSFAMKARASDVHIEPQESQTRVRYRIDGILNEKLILPASVHDAVISRIKILAHLKIDEKRIPQDGRFNFISDGLEVDLRISTLPTIHGEKIVMRLLKKNDTVPALEELGLRGMGLRRLRDAIKVPHGIILVTGPTGSGKTTTLYSVLHQINTSKVNIITLEDPVEYQITGVNQVQTNPQAGLTFASGLRSFLRQDPNIIMVGEIRDNETVELAVQASLTGHLVFSTLHTSSATGALPRMVDMGAEPFLLASSMTLAMAQRIVRIINPDYKEEYTPEPEVVQDIKQVLGAYFESWCNLNRKDPNQVTLFRSSPNRPVSEPEYKGRIGIFEVMPISDELRKHILQNSPAGEMEKVAVKEGMLLMKQDGYLKALEGITTIEEVLRVAEI